MRRLALIALVAVAAAACGGDEDAEPLVPEQAAPIELQSTAFDAGDRIPVRYTCDGQNISPPLEWREVEAEEFALSMTDRDADGFSHWVVFRIPGSATEIPQGSVPEGATVGRNDFDDLGYGGPCPPEGDEPHTYVFTIYALSEEITGVEEGITESELLAAIECCVSGMGTLDAEYGR